METDHHQLVSVEFHDPDLTYENFRRIMNKTFEITSLDDKAFINPGR